MCLKLSTIIVAFVLLETLSNVNCANYEFVLTDDQVFSSCNKDQMLSSGFSDYNEMLDLSNLTFEYVDHLIHVEGSFKFIADVDISDTMVGFGGVYQLRRGQWISTIFHQRHPDFCKVMWSKDEFWYESWTKYVIEEDRQCFHKDAVYHFRPYDIQFKFQNMNIQNFLISGRYKMDINFEVYDVNGHKKLATCLAIEGEILKYK